VFNVAEQLKTGGIGLKFLVEITGPGPGRFGSAGNHRQTQEPSDCCFDGTTWSSAVELVNRRIQV
jgi:hypothetical protein